VETWKPDTGQETLKWSAQEVYYTLIYISHTTPLGKDGLAAIAERMTTGPVSANLTPMPATATPEPTLDPNRWNAIFPLTPAQASEQAGFGVFVPSKMPGSLSFIGVRYDAQYHLVTLFYLRNCGDCDNSLSLNEQPASSGKDCFLCGFEVGDYAIEAMTYRRGIVGANATIETVQIGDSTGLYVEGEWDLNNGNPEWTELFPTKRLRWQRDGMAFEILDYSWDLIKEDLIAIAENMTTVPGSANSSPMPATATPVVDTGVFDPVYPLTLAQAAAQAGYDVLEPVKPPFILSFSGARYDAELNRVIMFYLLDQTRWGPNTDGLVLSEQLAPNGVDCGLCGFVRGDFAASKAAYPYKVVGSDATIETVLIGDVSGLYVEGNWEARDKNGMKWFNDPNVKILRFQKDGRAFELLYYGMAIDKEDLIAIAESIR
jgi:hypothetical protein